ncbi:MAG: TrpR like protein, YerC/YecD [Candidatus Magasanikbacteria bacterium GW2011_GWA2_45_39]|uniref:TrpR like protein, YerC/YecD n=2 Tax=Candidatus Magasanikiibacteriota TaxID=1752731 RepID=A0A0G1MWG2_9BACT|nr:MAG: TrpR like protein, YerC/YecD [Candidatus Magasanikbacteria bacterium GW2011_GWA2_45_39]KKU12636.1 MAG: TrpR like protein, YerC/YecD [Candidatus Magasanikbacteria bacterium GW2011_GWC2_45_8]HBW74405.1 hypothetical protein [Candidatus Magasanikbacteria bacterium]
MSIKQKKDRLETVEVRELVRVVSFLKNTQEAKKFLRDLMTENELLEFANRWRVARMLAEGVSYVAIEKATGMSSTTVARIHKWLLKGTGGYRMMLKRFKP